MAERDTLKDHLRDLQADFHTLAIEAPYVGLSWDESEDPPRFALVFPASYHFVVREQRGDQVEYHRPSGPSPDTPATRDVYGTKFRRLAERGGELLTNLAPKELCPSSLAEGRRILDTEDPAERWYRFVTTAESCLFKQEPEIDAYRLPYRRAENFGYVSEVAIDRLLLTLTRELQPDAIQTTRDELSGRSLRLFEYLINKKRKTYYEEVRDASVRGMRVFRTGVKDEGINSGIKDLIDDLKELEAPFYVEWSKGDKRVQIVAKGAQ